MSQKTFTAIASAIFVLVGLAHAVRLAMKWQVVLNGWDVPMWVSWIGLVVTLYLASQGFKLAKKG